MISNTIKKAAMLLPQIRRLKAQRDTLMAQVTELNIRMGVMEAGAGGHNIGGALNFDLVGTQTVEQILAKVRGEYTPLPRFAYHLPLDYEDRTLPPQFDPPVWVAGEVLPLPPIAERHGHSGSDTEYLDWGRYDHDAIAGHVRRKLSSLDNLAILDFGCSSGRVLRHFYQNPRENNWSIVGVDVSARKIEWMRRNFPLDIRVYTGTTLPIMPFESNSFDVIYGMSVFTHIKFLWDAWLLELRRVLKPGGVLIQSIHTENAWNYFSRHKDEAWARDALGAMIIDNNEMPEDFIYFGDIDKNQVFWKSAVALAFWKRYFTDVEIFDPPEKYSYQDWIVAQK